MNALAHIAIPTVPGTPFEGGFYVNRFMLAGAEYALIIAPKALGTVEEARYGDYGQDVTGAILINDGLANTQAMAEAGSNLGKQMLALDINGFTDWYLPSRDELEIIYRHLKPTTETNYTWRHGENASSVPPSYPYTEECPAQTTAADFQEGGEQALEDAWHLSSTQYSPDTAWIQTFDVGAQTSVPKDSARRAVAVRRYKVTP